MKTTQLQRNNIIRFCTLMFIFFLSLAVFPACDTETFIYQDNPEDNIAMHCILDTRNENSVVKIQKIYSDDTPIDMSKYKVTLTEAFNEEYILKDTLLYESPNTRFFVVPSDYIKRGKHYMLTLYENNKTLKYSVIQVFNEIKLTVIDQIVEPANGPIKWNVELKFPKAIPPVFSYRLAIQYSTGSGNDDIQYIEVPYELKIFTHQPEYSIYKMIYEYDYNILNKSFIQIHLLSDTATFQFKNKNGYYSMTYDGYYILSCLKSLKNKSNSNIVIKGISALFYSIDYNYYKFYMEVGQSTQSIRLDGQVPYNSNITGGKSSNFGFFGNITCDSVNFKIPEFLIKECGYIDGQ